MSVRCNNTKENIVILSVPSKLSMSSNVLRVQSVNIEKKQNKVACQHSYRGETVHIVKKITWEHPVAMVRILGTYLKYVKGRNILNGESKKKNIYIYIF